MSKKYNPCQCYAVRDGATDDGEPIFGECGRQTLGTFAPGHDAKLKGELLKLIRAGQEYHYNTNGLLMSNSPLQILRDRGWEHFNKPVAPRKPRKSRKAEPKAPKAKAEPEAPTEPVGFAPVRVKVGRWLRDATLVADNGETLVVRYLDTKAVPHEATVKRSALVA